MQRLVALAERTDVAVSLAFHDSRVFLAIPRGRNMFEAPVFQPAIAPKTIATLHDDVRELVSLVEELNLNTRIWSKV
jgi:hypothetical protein